MYKDVIIVNDFYDEPEAVVAYAKSLPGYYPYQDKTEVESGKLTPAWITTQLTDRAECPFRSSEELISKLEALTGDTIDRSYWDRDLRITNPAEAQDFYDNILTEKVRIQKEYADNPQGRLPSDFEVSLWNCAFHTKCDGDKTEAIHNHIYDYWQCCGEYGWNGIIYLNKETPERAGLKLWNNKQGNNEEWMSDHQNWDLIDDLGNVYNRLILFRGWLPHSGAPGFGTSPENGRLFQTFFFRTVEPEVVAPVSIAV